MVKRPSNRRANPPKSMRGTHRSEMQTTDRRQQEKKTPKKAVGKGKKIPNRG
jgi:hypothetical protein